jgi:glycine/D-amino acid oxidase-like deaminating enzyme
VDVVVTGTGVLGLALALELARRGVETVVVGDGGPGRWPASAAGPAGLVDAQARPGPASEAVRDLTLLSRRLWADWVEALEEETGLPCEYDVRGGLALALTEAEEVVLDRALDWQRARALAFDVLPGEDVRSREPGLSAEVRAAFSFPDDGQLPPARLLRALTLAARHAGVTVADAEVPGAVRVENGSVAGLETARGLVRAEAVVNAAGARAGLLSGVPPLPVVPVRTPHLQLDGAADPERLARFVHGRSCSLVPRRDGTVVVAGRGGEGHDPRLTAGEAARLLAEAARLVPSLAGYPLLDAWSSCCGRSPDGGPILGETALPGLVAAAGEGSDEILLAPALAHVVADLLTGRTPPVPAGPFSPARFGV